MVVESTVCHILRGDELLLIKASRGISMGKWNGVGGKLETGETPEKGAIREVYEESGLKIKNLFHHGTMNFYMNGSDELGIIVHVFSTRDFSGTPISTQEGELRWFKKSEIPYSGMWDDDNYWIEPMLEGKRFNAQFHFDSTNSKVLGHTINFL
ncbi:MAG: 8-oxo-dGTP diphosphatase [Candidatus Micrarchaeota archaeon]|nr:8-oxo-dGTP diphosphatase [Candidatus Micrarchaeota archaeon]MDE1847355.1 8-oxo-dGTP diphosphatase [Candidatus Micrarchaeota archaeon]MDE1863970.1 8-oxo-dGTP diphosphatase [Candidatus Micrarchaeota archaeon]